MSLDRFSLRHFISVLLLSVSFLGMMALPVMAAPAPTKDNSTGIGLKPALIEDSVTPGEQKTYQINVTNLSQTKQTYYLDTRDITSVTDGGVPIYAQPNEPKTGFEMSSWINLDKSQVDLKPQQATTVNVTVNVPQNATPGSHFAAVFISMIPPKMRNNGASVGYDVANIISLRVAGDAVVNTQIRQFSTGNYIYGKTKVDFSATVENKGNVLVRPYGPVEIFNMFGKRVAVLTMNDSKAGIFPGKNRQFMLTWQGDGPGFGRYQAILSLVYGEQGHQATVSSTISFWILPMNIILPALGVLALLLLVVYVSIRMYIRGKLRHYAGGARRIQRRRQGGMSALLLVTVVMLVVTALFLLALLALFA